VCVCVCACAHVRACTSVRAYVSVKSPCKYCGTRRRFCSLTAAVGFCGIGAGGGVAGGGVVSRVAVWYGRALWASCTGTRKRCAASSGLRRALNLPQVGTHTHKHTHTHTRKTLNLPQVCCQTHAHACSHPRTCLLPSPFRMHAHAHTLALQSLSRPHLCHGTHAHNTHLGANRARAGQAATTTYSTSGRLDATSRASPSGDTKPPLRPWYCV
jgi:hypothetical protein